MYCPNCGKENADDTRVCPACDTELVQPETSPPKKLPRRRLINIPTLFSETWKFFKNNYLILIGIQAIAMLPNLIFDLKNHAKTTKMMESIEKLSATSPPKIEAGESLPPFPTDDLIAPFSEMGKFYESLGPLDIFLIIAGFIFVFLGAIALIRAIVLIDESQEIDILGAYTGSFPYVLTYLFASILSFLATIGGLFLFIIPGVIFSIWFLFTSYAVVAENKGAVASLKRSKRLVDGFWGPVWGRFLLGYLIIAIIGLLTGPLATFPYFGFIIQRIISITTGAFMTIYLYQIFKSLKAIKQPTEDTSTK